MKIRPSILLLCVGVIILIILALWFKKKPIVPPLIVASPAQVSDTNRLITSPKKPAQVFNNPVSPKAGEVEKVMEEYRQGLLNKAQVLTILNDIPITFYGRLQDQFGNGVASANINFAVQVVSGQESTTKRGDVVSDVNGFFTITGYKGQNLAITPRKAGYTLATTSTLFWCSHLEDHPFIPDQNNPTIVKMWKLQGGEHLIHFQTQIHVPIDGSPIILNLQTGQQVQSDGDIAISVQTVSKPNIRQRYDWQAKIRATDGGLISSSDDFDKMFEAPDSGYEPEFDVAYQKDARPWTTTFNGVFYFTTRNGSCYGKLGIEVLSDVVKNGTVPVILNSYVNPASSRNLEIDPAKATEAHP